MCKVLWVSNVVIEPVAKACGYPTSSGGGWVQGLYDEIKNNKGIEIIFCFPNESKDVISGEAEGVRYYFFYQKTKAAGMTDTVTLSKLTEKHIKKILGEARPDILHLFGTEYPHTLQFLKLFSKPRQAIVHIQGLTSAYNYHYYADLPQKYIHLFAPSSIVRGTIDSQKKEMKKRGRNEIEALGYTGHVLGRTDWDRACLQTMNVECYHACNEILRETFYDDAEIWKYENCEKHTIFVSQATYPLKGFHYLLKAFPSILREFPDAKIYVGGNDPVKKNNLKGFVSRSPYGFYIIKLLKQFDIKENVIFIGNVSAEDMKWHYLKSNVFVLPSSIENSPNSLGEAMMLGVPCVAANVGGVPSMISHNIEGYTYQHNEIHMLSYYVRKMFALENQAERMGDAARKKAIRTHDKKHIVNQIIKLYGEINDKDKSLF